MTYSHASQEACELKSDDEIEDIKNELNDNISEMETLDFYKKYVIPKRI